MEISLENLYVELLGLKGLSIPANSYILGSLLRRGLCVVERLGRMEKEALFPSSPVRFLINFRLLLFFL